MKITRSQLSRIIKEETTRAIREANRIHEQEEDEDEDAAAEASRKRAEAEAKLKAEDLRLRAICVDFVDRLLESYPKMTFKLAIEILLKQVEDYSLNHEGLLQYVASMIGGKTSLEDTIATLLPAVEGIADQMVAERTGAPVPARDSHQRKS